jgi:hypothetical protein
MIIDPMFLRVMIEYFTPGVRPPPPLPTSPIARWGKSPGEFSPGDFNGFNGKSMGIPWGKKHGF